MAGFLWNMSQGGLPRDTWRSAADMKTHPDHLVRLPGREIENSSEESSSSSYSCPPAQ